MPNQSAGVLLYRKTNNKLQVFLVHPGGPFFKNKDLGVWSIPKGEFLDDEKALIAPNANLKKKPGRPLTEISSN